MNFKELLEKLNNDETMEDICKGTDVECVNNYVYDDDDLYDFLKDLGAEIKDFSSGYALISTNDGKYYEIPYEDKPNRFGDDLPDETMLIFNKNRIYDVTENWRD